MSSKKEMLENILSAGGWRFNGSDYENTVNLLMKNKKDTVENVYNDFKNEKLSQIEAINILKDKVTERVVIR